MNGARNRSGSGSEARRVSRSRSGKPLRLGPLATAAGLLLFLGGSIFGGGPTVRLSDGATCDPDGEVIVRLSVDTGGGSLASLDAAIQFDDTNLQFLGVFKNDFTATDYLLFSNVIPGPGPDTLDLSLFTATPLTPAADQELLWILFAVTGPTDSYPLTWDTATTFVNDDVPSDFDDGAVTSGTADVAILVPDDASAGPGGTVVIPITVDPADELQAFDVTLAYDPLVLTSPVVHDAIATQDFTLTVNDATPGIVAISLFSLDPIPSGAGETTIATVTFDVIGSTADSTPLDLTRGITDDGVSTCLDDGFFSVCASDVLFDVPALTSGAPGGTVDIPIVATPADDLQSFDFTLEFDPAVLSPDSVQTTPITAAFFLTTNFLVPGKVFISLFDDDAIPSGTGSTEVAIVTFNVVGADGATSPIDLTRGITDDGVSTCLDDGLFLACLDGDGDTVTDCFDICPDDPDPGQENTDGDAFGNACDCDPLDPLNLPPPAVGNSVEVDRVGVAAELSWDDQGIPGPFRLYRGFIVPGYLFSYNHTCTPTTWPTASASDALLPLPGTVFYYLVSRVECGESGLGFASSGAPRPNGDPCVSTGIDSDGDGTEEAVDNCPFLANADQANSDTDSHGDACDNCDLDSNPTQDDVDSDLLGDVCDRDLDEDGALNEVDNCPAHANPTQNDTDGDALGDACDPDIDGDGLANGSDNCMYLMNLGQEDVDLDGVGDICDNCPDDFNPDQTDTDLDEIGDACDP